MEEQISVQYDPDNDQLGTNCLIIVELLLIICIKDDRVHGKKLQVATLCFSFCKLVITSITHFASSLAPPIHIMKKNSTEKQEDGEAKTSRWEVFGSFTSV